MIWIIVLNQLYSIGCFACENRSYSSVKLKWENPSFQRAGSAEDLTRSPMLGCILFFNFDLLYLKEWKILIVHGCRHNNWGVFLSRRKWKSGVERVLFIKSLTVRKKRTAGLRFLMGKEWKGLSMAATLPLLRSSIVARATGLSECVQVKLCLQSAEYMFCWYRC